MKLNPVPSINSEEVCKRPSTIPTLVIHRKLPKKRDISIDEMQDFKENDTIFSFNLMKNIHLLDFNLEKQWFNTRYFDALIRTLYAQVLLVEELLNSGYEYVILCKLQNDPLEKPFSQYRQMSGGRFLVSLREVLNSEIILQCRSLLKENVNIWGRRCSTSSYIYIGSIY